MYSTEIKKVTTSQRLKTVATALAFTAVLTGCGSGNGAAATEDLSEADKTRIAEDFRECMSGHGFDANVNFDGGISIDVGTLDGVTEPTLEQEKMAEEECEKLLEALDGGTELDPEDEARLIDAAPALQKCLSDQGYDVQIEADGGISTDTDTDDGFDEAEYQLAEDACYKETIPELWEKFGKDS